MEVEYVDRDRAAAVVIGTKDIVNDLKSKKRRERMENANAILLEEEVDMDTYLAQGEHELKYFYINSTFYSFLLCAPFFEPTTSRLHVLKIVSSLIVFGIPSLAAFIYFILLSIQYMAVIVIELENSLS